MLGCQDKFATQVVSPAESLHISNEYIYLVSLEGIFTAKEIAHVHRADPTIKYFLSSGHAAQRKSDKDVNYKTAKEFLDITARDFKIIKKIKFGGSFMTDAVFLDVIEDSEGTHYVVFSANRKINEP